MHAPESYPPQWEFHTWDCPLEIHSEEKGRSLNIDCIKQLLDKVICHKLVLKSVSYPKIVKNTPILIEQSIACNVYT